MIVNANIVLLRFRGNSAIMDCSHEHSLS